MKHKLLVGSKVNLREMHEGDLPLLFDWENREELSHLGDEHQPISRAQISTFIREATGDLYTDGQLRLMINVDEKTIGCIDLFQFDGHNQRAGVGILIADSENRKNGYAKEALQLLCNYCFDVLHLRQLFCHIPANNEASLKLFSTCRFEKTGHCTDWVKKDNAFIDAVFMQRINA